MTLTKKQLEATHITAQNDAIALGEIYRVSFRAQMQKEITEAQTEELTDILQSNNELSETIVNTVAQAYADTIGKSQSKIPTVKLLKPSRERDFGQSDFQALLPMEKPKRLRSIG